MDESKMNREDIIRMAREAGAMFDHMTWVERDLEPVFERFSTLVAAAEREACAKVLDDMASRDKLSNYYKIAANVIRARGQE